MTWYPPFLPASRVCEKKLHERITRARKAREDVAKRIAKRFAGYEPEVRKWRTEDRVLGPMEPLDVL